MTVSFSKANAKLEALYDVPELEQWLKVNVKFTASIFSALSCPQAKDCLSSRTDGDSRKIKDGADCQFRCFSASQEATFPSAYNKRKANFDHMRSLKTSHDMANAIAEAMPKNLGICRIHVAGDFFNEEYFKAWQAVAYVNQPVCFMLIRSRSTIG